MTSPPPNPWDRRYGEPGYAYGTEPNDFLRESAHRIPRGGRVLCLADGEGRNGVFLAEQGFQVTGVDASAVGMAKARRLAAERGVHLETLVADLADHAIEPDSWDGIVSIFAHLPRPLRRRVHADCVLGLRPGGVFLLEAYRPAQLALGTGGPPVAELMMELGDLREELRGLELEIAREVDRPVREGRLHGGPSAVVQIVGVKPA